LRRVRSDTADDVINAVSGGGKISKGRPRRSLATTAAAAAADAVSVSDSTSCLLCRKANAGGGVGGGGGATIGEERFAVATPQVELRRVLHLKLDADDVVAAVADGGAGPLASDARDVVVRFGEVRQRGGVGEEAGARVRPLVLRVEVVVPVCDVGGGRRRSCGGCCDRLQRASRRV
jgi:hypothetical protein